MILCSGALFAQTTVKDAYALSDIVEYAFKHSPAIASAGKDVEIGKYSILSAKSAKNPKLNINASATRYSYNAFTIPLFAPVTSLASLPPYDNNIINLGAVFSIPLYTGGKIENNVKIQEYVKQIAEDNLSFQKQDLVYNLSSVFYKIMQLEKNLESCAETVRQVELHKKDVEISLKAGTVPKVELLKTQNQLARAKYNALLVENNLASAYELLKVLMGFEGAGGIKIIYAGRDECELPPVEESIKKAFQKRPDYIAMLKKLDMYSFRKALAESKSAPDLDFNVQYTDNSGLNTIQFKDIWNAGLILNVPILDGGFSKAETQKEIKGREQVKDQVIGLRQSIIQEIKDAYINLLNARDRIDVLRGAIEVAQENLRIENLKFKTGSNTSVDVFDAQAALLNSQVDYYQALYDEKTAVTALEKATGQEWGVSSRQ